MTLILFFIFSVHLVFGNCEFASTQVDFHTVADYNKTTDYTNFRFVDEEAFILSPSSKVVNEAKGIACSDIKSKYFPGDKAERDLLKISGCMKSDLQSGRFATYKDKLFKLKEVKGQDIQLSKEQKSFLIKQVRENKLLGFVKYEEKLEVKQTGDTKILESNLKSSEFDLKMARNFNVFGKDLTWYVLEAKVKYSLKQRVRYNDPPNVRDDTKPPLFKTYDIGVFEDTMPIVVYKYGDEISFFGNGLNNECGLQNNEQATYETTISKTTLPYFLPDKLYLLDDNKEVVIVENSDIAWSYEWVLQQNSFSVINNPYNVFPN